MQDNKKILNNSFFLYTRMFVTMWLTLYISRFLLQVLGVEDYGIYVLVGNIAIIFSFISSSFLIASERYIATAIVKNDINHLQKTFTTCVNCHRIIALLLLVISEIIGLYLINFHLNIPSDRLFAANVAFQASVVSCVFTVLASPYRAAIVAHEKMSFFAIEGIVLTALKLLIIFVVLLLDGDHLIIYSVLFGLVGISQLIINQTYCTLKLKEVKYIKYWDKNKFKEIFSFVGWNLLKHGSYTIFIQGTGIMFNLFGGLVVNAAYGIAQEVYGSCMTFMHNVQAAFYPQIIKECAIKDYNSLFQLVSRSARFSNFILILLILPILLNMNFILKIWLDVVPEYANSLSAIIILSCFVEAYVEPLNTTILANGDVKKYQMAASIVWLLSTIFVFVFLSLKIAFFVTLGLRVLAQFIILVYCTVYLKQHIGFPWLSYLKKDVLFSVLLLLVCFTIPYLLTRIVFLEPSVKLFVTTLIAWTLWLMFVVKYGLSKTEYYGIKTFISEIKYKYIKR